MIDKNGKIFGKVSIIDIIIVLAILVLGIGFVYRQTSEQLQTVLNPTDEFYIVFESNRLRGVNVDAISVGDIMFRLHDRQPMGTIIDMEVHPATETLRRSDGVAVLAEMEGRYRVVLTLESRGSITDTGYFVNGLDHIAPGSEVVLVSNRVYLPVAMVYAIGTERP